MSETPKKVLLDAALREWPDAEKSSMEWDARARSVLERLDDPARAAAATGPSDDDLLTAPLGQSVEDGHNTASPTTLVDGDPLQRAAARPPREGERMTMPVDRERDRRSLQDLAKLAQMTPPPPSVAPSSRGSTSGVQKAGEAKGEDSGLIDLGAVAAASEPQVEAPASAQLATSGLFDEEPNSVRPAPMSVSQPVPTIPPMPASVAPMSAAPASAPAPASVTATAPATPAAIAAAPARGEEKKGGKLVAVVFGVVALAAAAAGTFVVMSGHQAKKEAALAMADKPAAPAVTAAPAKAPEPTPALTATAAEAPPTEGTTDLSALPTAAAPGAKPAPRALAAKPATGAPTKAEPAKDDTKVASKDMPPPATGPVGALGDEMRKAVGDKGEVTAAAGPSQNGPASGAVPQKPSQGAITGALGAVLPEARRCLGPDDPISRASVVFGSNGTVQSVNVSGGAAGKPAEACIKGALMKAKVAPFAEATYSAPVTIRH